MSWRRAAKYVGRLLLARRLSRGAPSALTAHVFVSRLAPLRTFPSVLISPPAAAEAEEEGEVAAASESHTGKLKKKRKRNKKKKKGHAHAAAESTMKDETPPQLAEPPVDEHTGLTSLGVPELLVEGKAAVRKTLRASHHEEPEPHLPAKARGFLSDKGHCRSAEFQVTKWAGKHHGSWKLRGLLFSLFWGLVDTMHIWNQAMRRSTKDVFLGLSAHD